MTQQNLFNWDGINPRVNPETDCKPKNKIKGMDVKSFYESLILDIGKSLSLPPEAYADLPKDRK